MRIYQYMGRGGDVMDMTYRRIQFAREEGRQKELCQR
jgi:hypothetical protein